MAEEKLYKIAKAHSDYINNYHKYKMVYWDKFDYSFLTRNIMCYKKKGKWRKGTWNDVIIMADTETSKSHEGYEYDEFGNDDPLPNHIVCWTISLRAYHKNIVTLYGMKPSEFICCLKELRKSLKGDDIYIYFHNLAYDYVFLRLFLFDAFGAPDKGLNTKPHYPISVGFSNGIILKDSLILSGCKLEKWAKDLNVEHQKAVGSWDYDRIRDQDHKLTREEKKYIENDTLAGVECIDAMCITLKKSVYSIMATATGIVREEVRLRAQANRGKEYFLRNALSYDQYIKVRTLYHGGYSHGNRYYLMETLRERVTECWDFCSSYPFCLLAFRYPCSKFIHFKDCGPETILKYGEKYAFIFRVSFINIRLKDDLLPMPALQSTKCDKTINMCTDNGRCISAGYASLYICEQDLFVFADQYTWDKCYCTEVEMAPKDYLPRWFTDYVFELFENKCKLKKTKKEDPVNYALAKSKVNSLYGLTVQASIRENIIEVIDPGEYPINREGDTAHYDSGDYRIDFEQDPTKEYEKYLKSYNAILNYQIGTYCTAYAFRNLFELGKCVKHCTDEKGKLLFPPHWYYSDTDSCYSDDWDYGKIWEYNNRCKELLRANGYGPVIVDGKENWLGIAEHVEPEDSYLEYRVLGSKRYAGRSKEDNDLHITVAGVPKKGAKCLEDDLDNFTKNFIFDGKVTGKLTHYYIYSKKGIYTDDYGNEIGDSIDLKPCDYLLDAVDRWEYIFQEEVTLLTYGEDSLYDHI